MRILTTLLLVSLIWISGCSSSAKSSNPPLPTVRGDVHHTLEQVNGAGIPAKVPITLSARENATFVGWAFDSAVNAPASGVVLEAGGRTFFANYGVSRPDVAGVFHAPLLEKTGFQAVLPKGSLPPGNYLLTVRIGAANGAGYYKGRSYRLRIY